VAEEEGMRCFEDGRGRVGIAPGFFDLELVDMAGCARREETHHRAVDGVAVRPAELAPSQRLARAGLPGGLVAPRMNESDAAGHACEGVEAADFRRALWCFRR